MVSRDPVTRMAAAVFLVLLLSAAGPTLAGEELVLIVSARSDIDQLDSTLIRKLFLGLTVNQHGGRLRPLLNESDPQVKELFLQNIVSMSDSTYDRYVLRLALLQGETQPGIYKYASQLINVVASDPLAVSYVWARNIAHDPRVRVLRVVWHD
jgi:hypothetical protein